VYQVFDALMAREGWLGDLPAKATGAKEGWWGVSAPAESFLDELVTWRELGYNMTSKRDDYDVFESLPSWARHSLDLHESDDRAFVYGLDAFEHAHTHDPLWNAAQRQLVAEGRIHNYLRMLWGKKILEWSATPREALSTMIELNNKYALDGRDPNSYSGIFWVLGRYDRPWHPERPVLGVIRYMSSENTARKMRVKEYVRKFAGDA
jgi:deoxyribodipyrimidine photo-lyase